MKAPVRVMLLLLAVVVGLYVVVCAILWWQQDAMVFPGAGLGDRGVPPLTPPPAVAWVGEPGARVRIATVATGAPRAVVVYFGGNGEDLYAAVGSAAALAQYGVEAIAAEHPGYGASEGRASVDSLLGAAAAGGVDRVVLRSPPSSLVAVAGEKFAWLPVGWLLAHRFDSLAIAARVQCPVLVLHGDRDTIVPDRFGRELAAALPQARFVSVPGFGHNDLDVSKHGPVAAVLGPLLRGE